MCLCFGFSGPWLAEESSSFRTFAGNMDFLAHCKPLWFFLENVDLGDCSEEDSNGAIISQSLNDIGYTTRTLSYIVFA